MIIHKDPVYAEVRADPLNPAMYNDAFFVDVVISTRIATPP